VEIFVNTLLPKENIEKHTTSFVAVILVEKQPIRMKHFKNIFAIIGRKSKFKIGK
jgi:hypothetical protein